MSAAGAAVAAAASAAAKQRADQEEEEMTPYSADDLAQNWQFKILRSAASKFRDPVWMHAVLRGDVHSIRVGARSNVQDNAVLHGQRGVWPVIVRLRCCQRR